MFSKLNCPSTSVAVPFIKEESVFKRKTEEPMAGCLYSSINLPFIVKVCALKNWKEQKHKNIYRYFENM
jgi:hypothetical protein